MSPEKFVIWLKGFTEACHEYTPTPKQWDILKETLAKVEDGEDTTGVPIGPGFGVPNGAPSPYSPPFVPYVQSSNNDTKVVFPSGTTSHTVVWNDQMGQWHYTNNPEGFGYYNPKTAEDKKEKQQLND